MPPGLRPRSSVTPVAWRNSCGRLPPGPTAPHRETMRLSTQPSHRLPVPMAATRRCWASGHRGINSDGACVRVWAVLHPAANAIGNIHAHRRVDDIRTTATTIGQGVQRGARTLALASQRPSRCRRTFSRHLRPARAQQRLSRARRSLLVAFSRVHGAAQRAFVPSVLFAVGTHPYSTAATGRPVAVGRYVRHTTPQLHLPVPATVPTKAPCCARTRPRATRLMVSPSIHSAPMPWPCVAPLSKP
jgi:hypothetical protein